MKTVIYFSVLAVIAAILLAWIVYVAFIKPSKKKNTTFAGGGYSPQDKENEGPKKENSDKMAE